MLINEQDELLIQRCVDDELSPPETRALLQRLDRLDGGWKKLACELLEDRGLSKTFRSPFAQSGTAAADALQKPVLPTMMNRPAVVPTAARSAFRNSWSHPVTSLTLCAAIAFVGGLLIPDLKERGAEKRGADNGVVSNPLTNAPLNMSTVFPMAQNADGHSADSYRIQMTPGGQSVDIPVYDGIHDLVRSNRNHPLFSDSIQNADGRSSHVQWMIVPAGDNKSMLIPVSEDTLGGMQ